MIFKITKHYYPINLIIKFIFYPSILIFWEFISSRNSFLSFFLPPPSKIMQSLVANNGILMEHALPTIQITFIGLGTSIVFGLILSCVFLLFPHIRKAVYPLMLITQTMPAIALAPLLIYFFGFSVLPKIIMVVIYCIFPITISTTDSLNNVGKDLIKTFCAMNASDYEILRFVRFPYSLPGFFSGLKIASAYAMTGAIAGEYVGAEKGLGVLLKLSSNSHNIALMYADFIIIFFITWVLFAAAGIFERLLVTWKS